MKIGVSTCRSASVNAALCNASSDKPASWTTLSTNAHFSLSTMNEVRDMAETATKHHIAPSCSSRMEQSNTVLMPHCRMVSNWSIRVSIAQVSTSFFYIVSKGVQPSVTAIFACVLIPQPCDSQAALQPASGHATQFATNVQYAATVAKVSSAATASTQISVAQKATGKLPVARCVRQRKRATYVLLLAYSECESL